MSRLRVAVAVTDEALGRVQEVIRACCALGFREEVTLPWVGIFTGLIEADTVQGLRMIPGVAAVELERDSKIERRRAH